MLTVKIFLSFITGGLGYNLIELLYRKRTHWTMTVTGGLCFTALYFISTATHWHMILQCLVGAITITFVEFVIGCVVNLRLHWSVWNYSHKRFNVLGQICPLYAMYWFLLCFPAIWLAGIIDAALTL